LDAFDGGSEWRNRPYAAQNFCALHAVFCAVTKKEVHSIIVTATTLYSQTRVLTKGKRLIHSFILANLCDALLTGLALSLPGFVEKGLLAADMLAQAKVIELLIFKTAMVAFMVGIYALTAHRSGRWSYSIEAALKIGTVIVWLVVAWNELNIILALSEML